MSRMLYLHKDVVDGDVDQLDNKSNNAHDEEAHGDGLSDLHELCKEKKRGKSHDQYKVRF